MRWNSRLLVKFPVGTGVKGWLDRRMVSVLDLGLSADGPGFKIAAATLLGNSLRQTVHTRRDSVHQAAKIGSSPLKGYGGNCRPGGK